MRPAIRSPGEPLGTGRDLRARLLRHHAPLAVASAAVLAAFLIVPLFDESAHPLPDIFSGAFPQPRGAQMAHGGGHLGPMDHGPGQVGPMAGDANPSTWPAESSRPVVLLATETLRGSKFVERERRSPRC